MKEDFELTKELEEMVEELEGGLNFTIIPAQNRDQEEDSFNWTQLAFNWSLSSFQPESVEFLFTFYDPIQVSPLIK